MDLNILYHTLKIPRKKEEKPQNEVFLINTNFGSPAKKLN